MDYSKSKKNKSNINYLNIIMKHYKMIVVMAVLFCGISGIITFGFIKPKYTSTTELLVNQKLSKSELAVQAQQAQTDVQRVITYKDIITSPVIQHTVKHNLKNIPGSQNYKIDIQSQQNSQVFSVKVTSKNPYTSADIANETANVFQKKIKKMMDVNSVTVVSKATPKKKPSSPHYVLNLIAGLILGSILGFGLSIFKELNDRNIHDSDYLENDLGLNSLGFITEIDDKDMNNKNISDKRSDHRRRV
ncbi:YveK family protein [Fructilactobacillus sp. Tb1]|uniref:YveK family protein n=1 Tax=Fructilactobacillus sp. Tb1 TaxID=3422304 RepID=UPI003D296140